MPSIQSRSPANEAPATHSVRKQHVPCSRTAARPLRRAPGGEYNSADDCARNNAAPTNAASTNNYPSQRMPDLLVALHSGFVLLMDGAMGTQLQRAGIPPGACYE